ncbi:Domain of unknown function DUF305 [Candidatus Nanopelagicaceae bacterium]
MQINIDKKTGVFLAIITLLLAAVISLSINHSDNDGFMGMGHNSNNDMGMHHNSKGEYTGADIMFLQMMIPHHQQAIDISNLALKTSKDSELLALAKIIIAAQSSEIAQMKSWLTDAGAGTDMGHSMDGMGGMLDENELSALAAATGKNFNILWLKAMIGHHDGAIHMTTMIRDASNKEIKAFGQNVLKDQSAQITQMEGMLKRITP